MNTGHQCAYVTFLSAVSAVRAVNEMNGAMFCSMKIEVAHAQGTIPQDAVEVWRKNNRVIPEQELNDLEARPRIPGSEDDRPKQRRSWGDELGAPTDGEEAAAAVGASRGLAAYDDEEELLDDF